MIQAMDKKSSYQSTAVPHDVEKLQDKLDDFIRIAKSNERKQRHFQQYELDLLNCSSLSDLLSIILGQHRERFQLSDVTLLLLDSEYEFRRFLASNPKPTTWEKYLFFTDNEHMVSQYFSVLRKPRLSPYSKQVHQQLFPGNHSIQSVAILPLIRQNKFIGSLNLGSRSPTRFQHDMGTQFLQHLAAVISACIENARLQENIKQTGLLDPLTGVNNRRFFDQRLEEEITLAQRQKSSLCCLFLDLDHFKRINDTHGHQAGDSVLKEVAEILSNIMRTSDVLARYGGEEFVILLSNTPPDIAFDIAERIRTTINEHDFAMNPGKTVNITLSIGLATQTLQQSTRTRVDLINAADKALYNAKVAGRNRVHCAGNLC